MNYSDNMENPEDSKILPEIKNWKLREVITKVSIVACDSVEYRNQMIELLKLPTPSTYEFDRSQTNIEWDKMPEHYKFFFDREGWEEKIKEAFESSELKETKNLIICYGWKEPAIMIPAQLFFDDWEGFIASTIWETVIFSEDFKLIMEVSRDYYLHSNFKIMEEK